jgi:hypothetical protein
MVRGFAVGAMFGACALVATAANAQCPTPATVSAACSPPACAEIDVGDASGTSSAAGTVSISFTQAPDDAQAQRGADDVAAIAFTVGLPGTGDAAPPLVFDCVDGNLAENAVVAGSALGDNFTVVAENAQCTGRNHCLCPDTTAGQERDNFVNIAVYGPKTLPEQGPVTIPELPNGEIVQLVLKAAADATPGPVTLHVFSALDGNKPQFAANASIGDQSACDVSAASDGKSALVFDDGTFTITGGGELCPGDCNGDGEVAINELIIGVNIALGSRPVADCPSFDISGDGSVAINELISAVNAALNGCP